MTARGTMLTDSGTGHSGPRLQVVAKKAAGQLVTISRVAYGTPVQPSAASKVTFGHLHHEVNFAGVNVGDELCTGVDPRRFRDPERLMSTPIQEMMLLLDLSGMQVWRVTTESCSVYELHVIK